MTPTTQNYKNQNGGDAQLIAQLQNRDTEALAELYDRYGRLVYSMILRVVHDVGVAEDLVQETFMRVWNRVQGFDGHKGSIGPWLLAIARNRAIDYLRSVRNRDRNTVEFDESAQSVHLSDAGRDVEALYNRGTLRAALSKLRPNHSRAIELAYFEGLSHAEVAERMGQPLGTVKSWVRVGLDGLREELMPVAARRAAAAAAATCWN